MEKKKTVQGVIVFLIASVLIALTSISLIFGNPPDYIYLNMVGIFLFSLYFGWAWSLLYAFLIQVLLMKFGLFETFVSYSLIVSIVQIVIIQLVKYIRIHPYLQILLAGAIMAILARPLATLLSNALIDSYASRTILFSAETMISQCRIYGFSTLVTLALAMLLNRLFHTQNGGHE